MIGFVALACMALASSDEPRTVELDRQTVLTATLGTRKVTVVLRAKEWPTKDVVADATASWAFGDSVTVLQDVKIVVGESAVFVPRSSYADLLDVRTARIEPQRDVGVLFLRGGDASTSFEASIEFDGKRVRRRTVSGLAGPVEETVYMRRVLRDVPSRFGVRRTTQTQCPPEADAPVARVAASWGALHEHFKRFSRCDDGAVYEGFSEAVVALLATSWDQLPQLAELVQRDDAFRTFVMKHIDDMAGQDPLRTVRERARRSCPPGVQKLCDEIARSADHALGAGAPNRSSHGKGAGSAP